LWAAHMHMHLYFISLPSKYHCIPTIHLFSILWHYFILTRSVLLCVITISTEEYSLPQQYVFKLIKPGYMFQLYSHYQAYLQSLVELYMLNAYDMWDPSSKATDLHVKVKNMNLSAS
jgi:hypothetical protein